MSPDILSFLLSLLSTLGESGGSLAQSCTVMWVADGSVHLEKSLRSNAKSGFVDGLWILEIKFGTFRVSWSALTCDASGDLEAPPLTLVGVLTPLRFLDAGVGARLSVATVPPVLETRLAVCSSLEPKVDLDVELWSE